MRTCYLVGAAPEAARIQPGPGDFVIAADGGYDHLLDWGIVPDFIVGDLDSLRHPLPEGVPCRKAPAEKDETDMALAFWEGWLRGCRRFEIVGASGARPDHTLANLQLLVQAARCGAFVLLRDGGYCAAAITDQGELRLRGAGTVSVFAYGEEARGVNLLGMKYTLENGTLRDDTPQGVSNALEGGDALISLTSGVLMIFWEQDIEALVNV